MGGLGRVGPYTMVERLGRGGMGDVYLAVGRRGVQVAVKMLRDPIGDDPDARLRLDREVRALRRVESPYVARVLDADLSGDRPYLVMEHIEGETLLDAVRRSGPLSGAALIDLARGLATAIAIIHAAGVVHRDVKPANVVLGPDGPVLIDFGIAQVADATRVTMTGTFLGTPGYSAPEVFAEEPVGTPADVHSWAATVAFAATGRPTFGRGSVEAQMYAVLNGRADLAGVPGSLLPLVRAALNREPDRRPTAVLLSDRLSRLARAAGCPPPPDGWERAVEAAAKAPGDDRPAEPVKARGRDDAGEAGPSRRKAAEPDGEPAGPSRRARAEADGEAAAARRRSEADGERGPAARRKTEPAEPERVPGGRRRADPDAERATGGRRKPDTDPERVAGGRRKADTDPERVAGGRRKADIEEDATPAPRRRVATRAAAAGERSRTRAEGALPRRAAAGRTARSGADGKDATAAPPGGAVLIVLAMVAVPCVVASVIWPVATLAITSAFCVLARAWWSGHWLVRNRRSSRVRGALRVVSFPVALAGSAVSAVVWPGIPAGAIAASAFWLAAGGHMDAGWWTQPGPMTVAGVVFGVVCGGIVGREIERVGARVPDLRREGLRALSVLGGFVALCAAAVRVFGWVLPHAL
ncbi:hypothetical protein Sru01_60530 [Sphaerisporangium rufum]|uniref:Protein kinase domain-containing protein n=1 Tax=Sphaerisporangium rufum TaxID=1381558 RepID=A0A919V1G4_9ACTN|nr:hypothetical protein Sru01_60530 [Sphaerisporangium rufum]